MIRTINTKFYTFHQNDIDGIFIIDDEVAQFTIIEALDKTHAKSIMTKKLRNSQKYYSLYEDRWDLNIMEEHDSPKRYDKDVYKYLFGATIIHYLDDQVEKIYYNEKIREDD